MIYTVKALSDNHWEKRVGRLNRLRNQTSNHIMMPNAMNGSHMFCNYLPVSDLSRSRAWYMLVLGLKPFDRNESILIMGSGQWVFLLESKDRSNANFMTDSWEGKDFEMFSLTFETENIVALHKSLVEHGVEVEPITDKGSCGLQFRFKDLDGNRFNVWQN